MCFRVWPSCPSCWARPDLSRTYQQERKCPDSDVSSETGWDGEWYLRAIFDDGTPLGSSANEEARIDSLPQSWAWLSGAADPDRADKALESAWKHLVREDEGLVLLFEPPFDNIGAVTRIHQGVSSGSAGERRPVHSRRPVVGHGLGPPRGW